MQLQIWMKMKIFKLITTSKACALGLLVFPLSRILAAGICLIPTISEGEQEGDFTYSLSPDKSNKVTITKYTGKGGVVTIPSTIGGMNEIGIDPSFFEGDAKITKLVISGNVYFYGERIGSDIVDGFEVEQGSKYLSSENGILFNADKTRLLRYPTGAEGSYIVPVGVKSIHYGAFFNCRNLTEVTITVSEILSKTFSGCINLERVSIGDGVSSLVSDAFDNCSRLTEISLPASISISRSFDGSNFDGCTSLQKFVVSEGNMTLASVDGVLYQKNMTYLVRFPEGKRGPFVLPATVTEIGAYNAAFRKCRYLDEILVAEGNSKFHSVDGVLYNHDKSEIICYPAGKPGDSYTVPASVTRIGGRAFSGSHNLLNIEVAAENQKLQSVEGVLFSDPGKRMGGKRIEAFPSGRAGSYNIPADVSFIRPFEFTDCRGLTSVTIPASVTKMENPFESCLSLASVVFAGKLPGYGRRFFESVAQGFTVYSPTGASDLTDSDWLRFPIREGKPSEESLELQAWISNDGKTLMAAFEKLMGDSVVVKDITGKQITIPLSRLSPESSIWAKALGARSPGK